jgi:hypothetical protein
MSARPMAGQSAVAECKALTGLPGRFDKESPNRLQQSTGLMHSPCWRRPLDEGTHPSLASKGFRGESPSRGACPAESKQELA